MKPHGRVEINLDKVRHLKFSHNGFCVLDEILNPLTPEVLKTHRGQRALLYAGLVHEDRGLTLEQAGNFFDDHDPAYIMNKIAEAMEAARPSVKDGEDTSPNASRPVNGSGTDSLNRPLV
jgi:hypothetical protein